MKNLFLTVIFVAVATFTFGQNIAGSAHDFSDVSYTWNTLTSNKLCGPCHTPHNAYAATGGPLWSHAPSTVLNYVMYSSSTFDGAATMAQPTATSKACLSCHDGSVALDNYIGVTPVPTSIAASAQVGGPSNDDLSNDHPISFDYVAGLDPELRDPALIDASLTLFTNKMECATCHDPHGTAFTKLTVMDNAGSEMCLSCHIK